MQRVAVRRRDAGDGLFTVLLGAFDLGGQRRPARSPAALADDEIERLEVMHRLAHCLNRRGSAPAGLSLKIAGAVVLHACKKLEGLGISRWEIKTLTLKERQAVGVLWGVFPNREALAFAVRFRRGRFGRFEG